MAHVLPGPFSRLCEFSQRLLKCEGRPENTQPSGPRLSQGMAATFRTALGYRDTSDKAIDTLLIFIHKPVPADHDDVNSTFPVLV